MAHSIVHHARMVRLRAELMIDAPFFGTLALKLALIQRGDIDTMATDGKSLYYNTSYLDELDDDEAKGVICHEVFHCSNKHHLRRGDRDFNEWNISCDLAINPVILRAGFKLPKDLLLDWSLEGLSAEDIYSMREKNKPQEQPQKPQPGKGEAGDDGDEDGESQMPKSHGDPGRCGEILDAPGDAVEQNEQEREWDEATRQAVNVATKHAGKVPAHLNKLVEDLNKPSQDWREQFRQFVDPASRFDYSWSVPDRRFGLAPFILPGTVREGINHGVILIDTSGSCYRAIPQFKSEVQAMLDQDLVDRITLVYADTQVQEVIELEAGDEVPKDTPYGGGTDFRQPIEWVEENAPDASFVVYLTDLYGPAPEQGPTAPFLWAVYGNPRGAAPFGDRITVEIHNERRT